MPLSTKRISGASGAWNFIDAASDLASEATVSYFKEIFDYVRTLNPQHRPLTYTNLMMTVAGKDKCHQFVGVVCLNRYYGWYMQGGYQLAGTEKTFIGEMSQWMNTESNKSFLPTEYITDADVGVRKLPSVQWSEEYRCKYLTMRHEVLDMFEVVVGGQVWSLCDSRTSEGTMHVDGNKKGVLTHDRQLKIGTYVPKGCWETGQWPAPGIFQEQHTSHNIQRNMQERTS